MNKNHLVIFLKAPHMGQVKTRLAKDIGQVAAWRFYKRCAAGIIKRVGRGAWQTTICLAPDDYKGSFFKGDYNIIYQGGGDLGQRMQRVFDNMPRGNVVLIGGDIPAIKKYHIERAFKTLRNHDAVFGPAEDGGFWLVGFKRTRARIAPFNNVRWSTPDTLNDTLDNIAHHIPVAIIDTLNDVDTVDDL